MDRLKLTLESEIVNYFAHLRDDSSSADMIPSRIKNLLKEFSVLQFNKGKLSELKTPSKNKEETVKELENFVEEKEKELKRDYRREEVLCS